MNSALKAKVLDMRNDGLSYAKISESMGLSINTIKSFLRRNETKCKDTVLCKNCRKPLEKLSRNGMKKFCCDSCRFEWWRKNAESNRKCIRILVCKACGKKFKSYDNKDRKYCSHECYIKYRFKD